MTVLYVYHCPCGDQGYLKRADATHAGEVIACTACGAAVILRPAPLDISDLIAAWEHEASTAEQLRRVDGYAALCRETIKALRELDERRRAEDAEWQGHEALL